ncbi:MAG: radical SAM protein [Treponema sp.]|uniref:radical SAM protein n=1 Tax=Treponema sp. TaxID=166 RepID=UPI001DC8F520|nr:radical SAM protein [Treponema sp.]MBS7309897.1 radical SAM protein [Treponema sp.]
MLNTLIIQPPLVQLNTPYPSGAYLLDFFNSLYEEKNVKGRVEWFDLSNSFFHKIFCKHGIAHIFNSTFEKALKLSSQYESQGDDNTAFHLRRFISQKEFWINWIDEIIAIVCSSNSKISGREFAHEFIRSAHVPRGMRVENFLSNLNRDVSTDDAQILSSLALADLADYITMVYDQNFALIRYAEHLATSTAEFSETIEGLKAPSLNDFYKPLLLEKIASYKNEPTLYCISVPFPGCFESALFSADLIRKECGDNAIIIFGGGYVNTELREISEKGIFDYCHILSYDKGYGSYIRLFDEFINAACGIEDEKQCFNLKEAFENIFDSRRFYNFSYLKNGSVIIPLEKENEEYKVLYKKEHEYIRKITPDYSHIDFTKYPRLADDTNPMHRIWNDGAWLKAYIAHGCYWHRCAFCDTTLDYVKDYCLTDINSLYDSLCVQAEKTGVHGIHFVDEACPPVALQNFALKNMAVKSSNKIPLTYWGNIRFEKTFDRDLADLLSAGGLTAVSAGIEIATGNGLSAVNKGTDMENIVNACCAFKEAGILIHSYMIFGFWSQSVQDLIDSMETLRQLFEAGLLDSAFWHKFTLTLHSTVYEEYKKGKYPELKILPQKKTQFAKNDLHFEGEEKSEKFSAPLNAALELWMHGEKLSKPVESYFPFKMPKPSIAKDYIASLIAKYEENRDRKFHKIPEQGSKEKLVWLGGVPLLLDSSDKSKMQICWSYMGELLYADIEKSKVHEVANVLETISAKNYDSFDKDKFSAERIYSVLGKKLYKELRGKGLCSLI